MNRIREVERRRASREGLDLALGREDEDLVVEQVLADRVHELLGVLQVAVQLKELTKPRELGGALASGQAVLALLVGPMRGDAVLRVRVHVERSDLNLDALALRADDRGVQGLVAVGLRQSDVVLEAPGDWLP